MVIGGEVVEQWPKAELADHWTLLHAEMSNNRSRPKRIA